MYPDDRQYSKEHEWIKMEGDRGTVGITDYAQKQLGDADGAACSGHSLHFDCREAR